MPNETATLSVIEPLLPVVGRDLRVPVIGGGEMRYANFDYAASAPALESVARDVVAALPSYASVHRGAGFPSQISTAAYEQARDAVSRFVGARVDDVVVFTRNTTDSLNLLANSTPGTAIVLDIEHHANLLPWLERGAHVLAARGTIVEVLADLESALRAAPVSLVAVTAASNVTGERLPLRAISDIAHRYGARLAVDGAQLVPHRRIDLVEDGIDYLAFSGHKLYAPFGAGVLVGRADWLDAAPAHLSGGGAVSDVSLVRTAWKSGPARHEAGSPNVIGAVAIASAIAEIEALDTAEWFAHERCLRSRLLDGLEAIPGVTVHRLFTDSEDAVGIVSFTIDGISARRAAICLSARWGIGVRDGRFCAHPAVERFGGPAIRASIGLGSSSDDVDRLIGAVAELSEHPRTPKYDLVDERWVVREDTAQLS